MAGEIFNKMAKADFVDIANKSIPEHILRTTVSDVINENDDGHWRSEDGIVSVLARQKVKPESPDFPEMSVTVIVSYKNGDVPNTRKMINETIPGQLSKILTMLNEADT
jgi:hypothetical protein